MVAEDCCFRVTVNDDELRRMPVLLAGLVVAEQRHGRRPHEEELLDSKVVAGEHEEEELGSCTHSVHKVAVDNVLLPAGLVEERLPNLNDKGTPGDTPVAVAVAVAVGAVAVVE